MRTSIFSAFTPFDVVAADRLNVFEGEHVKLLPAAFWRALPPAVLRGFCWANARYGVPTREAVEFVRTTISGRSAIEIGAGAGDWAYHLGIPATDSKCQSHMGDIRQFLESAGQPAVSYGTNVEQLDALAAVEQYRPQVVFASWVTQLFDAEKDVSGEAQAFIYGVNELALLKFPSVETYIVVGNMNSHGRKRARRHTHSVLKGSEYGLVSRAEDQSKNCIFVWNTRRK